MTSGDESERPIMFGRARLGPYRHVCAFFNTPDEEYGVLLPFIGDGFVYGEKAFHIVDPLLRADHLKRLGAAGIDVEVAQRRGQLEVRNWEDAYLRGGRFDEDAMLSLVEEVLSQRTFSRTRLVAHMEWALQDRPGLNDLLAYEARVNYILPKYPDPVVCTYDLAKFGAGVVMDILRTHPVAVIGGILQENPFFVPPDEFLRELRQRAAHGARA